MTRLRTGLFVFTAMLATAVLTTGLGNDAQAKPYACGNQTCGAKDANGCQKCTSAVCDKNPQGQEVLVPGTATTTKCEKPAASMEPGPTRTPPRTFQRPMAPIGGVIHRGVEDTPAEQAPATTAPSQPSGETK